MPTILTRLIGHRKAMAGFFSPMTRSRASNIFQKFIHNKKFAYSDSEQNIAGIFHHTITAEEHDKDPKLIAGEINSIISNYKQSLLFLTQKSRILKRSDTNSNSYLPLQEHEILDFGLMIDLIKNKLLIPEGGHTCMAITDQNGAIIEESQISIRPDKKLILPGRAILHPGLFKRNISAAVKEATLTILQEEILSLSAKMLKDKNIAADISIVPIAQSKVKISEVMDNIKSVRTTKLYNLCSSIVKTNDITEIDDIMIRNYIDELKTRASAIPELRAVITDKDEVVLAALACTHAIAKACFGNADIVDVSLGPDQATQTAVVYCIMSLIGSQKFLDFAKKIDFHDVVSRITNNRQG